MSAFLGPIHFWLYDKIGLQEELTKRIAKYAKEQQWIGDERIYIKELPALEEVIDEANIHGWLQEQIHAAEDRYATLVEEILSNQEDRLVQIVELAKQFGKEHGLEEGISPKKAYEKFEDVFVNGMPCDRINAVLSESEEKISWEMTRDIHGQYWKEDANVYYKIRNSIMEGMLASSGLRLVVHDCFHYEIQK